MGWGISIPALGIKTGDIVTGDVGKVLTNVSRELNTPLGRSLISPTLGIGTAIENQRRGVADVQKQQTPFEQLTSKWDQMQADITGKNLTANTEDIAAQAGQNVGAGLQALGQKGGQSIGAAGRMQTQSKWDQAAAMAQANQAAQQQGTQFGMNKIMGVDIPVIQGKQMAQAQADYARKMANQANSGLVGGLIGTAAGAYLGGPQGAAMGYQTGSGIGSSMG